MLSLRKSAKDLVLIGIVLLSFVFRFYKFTEVPPSLNWDEVSIGYNAYSILKTGKDEWGKLLPLHFQSYGEYKLPAQIYASIPGIAVFGLNEFGVRITPVIYGTLTIILLYFLVMELFGSRYVSLLASLLFAVSPWYIQLTRASFESSFSVFWIVMALWFLIKGFKGNKYWWVLSMIPFAVSVYTYNSARVFTPLFLFIISLIYWKKFLKYKKQALMAFFTFVLLLIPLVPFVLSGEVSARYKLVSITNEEGLIPRINERRGLSRLPDPLPTLIHNKVTYLTFYFAKNYLAHFTPNFLFIKGAPHVQHSVQGMGELYKVQAPFLLIGLYFLIKKKERFRWLLIVWLLISYVPVATTKDSIPNALRTLIAAPFYQILSAYGFVKVFEKIKTYKFKYILTFTFSFILLVEMFLYLNNYFSIYPKKYSRDWQYGYKEVLYYIKEHYHEYDLIVLSRSYGEPHMFTLFFLKYPPDKYMYNPNLVRYKANDWVWVTSFDKFYFPDLGDKGTQYMDIISKYPDKRILFVGKKNDFPDDKDVIFKVDFLNGENAFVAVEY